MTTLLIAEHDNTGLKEATARALTAAAELGGDVHVLVAGNGCAGAAAEAGLLAGVVKVLHADDARLAHQLSEPLAALVVALAPAYDAFVAPATATGKTVMPRIAALLDTMQVSEIVKVVAPDTFERPIYAGNAIETVKTASAKRAITVRTAAFKAATPGRASAPIEMVAMPAGVARSEFVSAELTRSERPELTAARIVVSGGRAFQSAENFRKYLEPLADKLKAAIGASRAAVDAGYAPNELQVGQTGKIVAPDIYFAIGISGAIQHLAGMKEAKVIVAINKDPDAPIFAVADYGLVGDLYELLPALEQALKLRTQATGTRTYFMTQEIRTIGVVGAGQMGSGIAQVAALAGYRVLIHDVSRERAAAAIAAIAANLGRQASAGKLSEAEKTAAVALVGAAATYQDLADADLVVEAAVEDEAVKRAILRDVSKVLKPAALLATNTSSISITRLAAATDRPEKFIGIHFMNPVPKMELVEIIRGIATADATFEAAMRLTARLNKTAIRAEDFPAFIVNRVLMPMINEAIYALHEGVGTVDAIDTAMRLGAHHPMGPLQLADFIGLDTCLSIMQVLHEGLADSKYRPCPLLVKYVEAGWLGRKTGRGFYDYSGAKPVPTR